MGARLHTPTRGAAWRAFLCLLLAALLAVYPLAPAFAGEAGEGSSASAQITGQEADAALAPADLDGTEAAGGEAPAADDDAADSAAVEETPEAEDPAAAAAEAPDAEAPANVQTAAGDADSAETAPAVEAPEAVPDADESAADAATAVDGLAADEAATNGAVNEAAAPATDAAVEAPARQVSPAGEAGAAGTGQTAQSVASASPAGYQPALNPVSGVIPLLVVVAGFVGEAGSGAAPSEDGYDWANTVFASESGVSAYYLDMSNGAFTFTPASETSAYGVDGNTNKADAVNDGVVHVTMNEAHGNWAGDYYSDVHVAGAMLDAFARILAAAGDYVDFASYDKDGNGSLTPSELALAFVIAGYESAMGEPPAGAPTLWSHAWSYTDAGLSAPVVDGVTVDEYIAIAEKMRESDATGTRVTQEPLAVLTHELGHNLGLPDLYATDDDLGDWANYGVDSSSLMATGNWATATDAKGNTAYVPAAMDAWSRYQLGWVKPTVVTKSGVYTVHAQDSAQGYSVLLVPTANQGEYYLIENRTFTGHDAGLAGEYYDFPNGGIVIWHIDNGVVKRYLATNAVNNSDHRPGVMPLFAEQSSDSWNYTLDFAGSVPDTSVLFWSKSMWEEYFAGAGLLNLPLYGSGSSADNPAMRVLSGIRIEFLTNAGADMQIRILMPGDELPKPEEPAQSEAVVQEQSAATRMDGTVKAKAVAPAETTSAMPATGDEAPVVPLVLLALASFAAFQAARDRRLMATARHAR